MKKIFVSGCYDIIHAGHIQFFKKARVLGDHLIVCFASDEILWTEKKRRPSIPIEHKKFLIQALEMVDNVVIGQNLERGLDFKDHFLRIKPDVLAVTEDDKYDEVKRELCSQTGAQYRVLPKTPPKADPISSSKIVRWIRAPREVPLRVDFAGGVARCTTVFQDGWFYSELCNHTSSFIEPLGIRKTIGFGRKCCMGNSKWRRWSRF